jgi:hypothetical protein
MSDQQVERGELIIPPNRAPATGEDAQDGQSTEEVAQPAKVLRIGSMVKQLLDEVRNAPLDERSRERLAEIYDRSVEEVRSALSPDLQHELESLTQPFAPGEAPSEAELRIAKAQLVGWLEGLFHGIQAALVAQQMAARAQLEHMRGRPALPRGGIPGLTPNQGEGEGSPGQYL